MPNDIEVRVDWDFVRYANCWEDASILVEALQPGPGKRMLSIASGGDNSFALLAAGAEVVAADLNFAQLACVELKKAAIRELDQSAFLAFLGVRPSTDRAAVYRKVRSLLSGAVAAYWDRHIEMIECGLVHAGKFERYFTLFRTRVLPLVHRRKTVEALMKPRGEAERRAFYEGSWNTTRWRMLFRIFFSRFVMGRLGRDPEFFRYVEGSVAERIFKRAEYAFTTLSIHDNPYLDYILNGNFTQSLPPYLQPGTYERVRANLDRLSLQRGTIQDAGRASQDAGFDGFNLSDIFEYLDPPTCADVYGNLLNLARPGARFAYWNMLAPRKAPECFAGQVVDLADTSSRLFARDRAFFYSRFVVEEKR